MSAAQAPSRGTLENVTVTTADGRVFDLGKPTSRLFWVRVLIYKLRRRFS